MSVARQESHFSSVHQSAEVTKLPVANHLAGLLRNRDFKQIITDVQAEYVQKGAGEDSEYTDTMPDQPGLEGMIGMLPIEGEDTVVVRAKPSDHPQTHHTVPEITISEPGSKITLVKGRLSAIINGAHHDTRPSSTKTITAEDSSAPSLEFEAGDKVNLFVRSTCWFIWQHPGKPTALPPEPQVGAQFTTEQPEQ